MPVFERIAEQVETIGLPLFAVTLTALPRVNTPVLLMLHWHGFRPDPDAPRAAGEPAPAHPVPTSALQLNDEWPALARLDQDMLEAAWRLGAWELDREERRACNTIGATQREALECLQAFGADPPAHVEPAAVVAEAPDRPRMLRLAERIGYVRWQFRPVRGGVWRATAEDDTLAPDGGRAPPCPVAPRAAGGARSARVRYRLGSIGRILLP